MRTGRSLSNLCGVTFYLEHAAGVPYRLWPDSTAPFSPRPVVESLERL